MVAVRRDRTAIFFGISLLVAGLVAAWIAGEGWRVEGIETSPITGPEGNVEYLIAAIR